MVLFQLYNEVKARREGNTTEPDSSTQDGFPTNSKKNEPAPSNHHCSGYFLPPNHQSNGINSHLDRHGNSGTIAWQDPDGCHSNVYSHPTHHSNGCSCPEDHCSHKRRDSVEVELEDILHSCLGQGLKSSCGENASIRATNGCQSIEHSQQHHMCNNDERPITGAVNSVSILVSLQTLSPSRKNIS